MPASLPKGDGLWGRRSRSAPTVPARQARAGPAVPSWTHDDHRLDHRRASRSCSPSTGGRRGSWWVRCRWRASRWAPCSGPVWARLCCPSGSDSPYAPVFGLAGALVAGAILATGLETLGFGLRRLLPRGGCSGRSTACWAPALTACVALGIAWIAGAVALQTPGRARAAPRHPALGRAARAQRDPAAVGPDPQRARALRSLAAGRRADARGRRAARLDPARPAGPRRAAQRGARAGHRLRAGDPGLGLGRRSRGSWSPTRTWSRARTTRSSSGSSTGRAWTRRRSPTTRATTSPSCASRGSARRRCGWPRTRRPGQRRGRSSAIPRTAPTTRARAGWATPRPCSPQDAYGRGPIRREITSLRGLVRSGNSGGPVVDGRGRGR